MEKLLSAGIDIGTSTTQLIFSELTIENTGGFGSVPKIEVVDKKIIYRSKIYDTPLISDMIDGAKVAKILEAEYKKANISPDDLSTGAVIITGESVRRRNAKEVTRAISEFAGDFVVAAAGADLESVLSGKGSGACTLSYEKSTLVANLDIGGGTTNISLFENGNVVDTACINIGGRLIRLDENNTITDISPRLKPLLADIARDNFKYINVGDKMDAALAGIIAEKMTKIIAESIGLKDKSDLLDKMITNHGLSCDRIPEIITFSGGVADCMKKEGDLFRFRDLGPALAKSIFSSSYFAKTHIENSKETVNATVVGAGNFSMELSGSTIFYQNIQFPIKNIPVFSFGLNNDLVEDNDTENVFDDKSFIKGLTACYDRLKDSELEALNRKSAISFSGIRCPSFKQIETIATEFVDVFSKEIAENNLPIIICREDIGKVLGQAIRRRIGRNKELLCMDTVDAKEGDFVDIGQPMADGKVVPVVVKTLVFEV